MSKKYFWLKLKTDFFERDEIRIIEKMPQGKDYIILYLKLLLKTVKTEGKLIFRDTIPFSAEMISAVTAMNEDTVRVAIDLFLKLNLIEKLDNGTLFLTEVQNMVGSETDIASRMRKMRAMRAKQKKSVTMLRDSDASDEKCDRETETEKDIEKDIEQQPHARVCCVNEKMEKWIEEKSRQAKNPSAYAAAIKRAYQAGEKSIVDEFVKWQAAAEERRKTEEQEKEKQKELQELQDIDFSALVGLKIDQKKVVGITSQPEFSTIDLIFEDRTEATYLKQNLKEIAIEAKKRKERSAS